jgi:hypothetical protein
LLLILTKTSKEKIMLRKTQSVCSNFCKLTLVLQKANLWSCFRMQTNFLLISSSNCNSFSKIDGRRNSNLKSRCSIVTFTIF